MHKRHRRIEAQHILYEDDIDKERHQPLESMENVVDELSFLAYQTEKEDEIDKDEESDVGRYFWVSRNPKHIYRMEHLHDIHVRIPYTQVILYLTWKHLYWVKSKEYSHGIVLPMHILAYRIIENIESLSPILQTQVESHTIIFETLIALAKGKGAIHFCVLDSTRDTKEMNPKEKSKHDLLGDGLGVFFDLEMGKLIYDAMFRRRVDIKQSYIEQLIPIHDACFQAMVDKEAIALFKQFGNINSEMPMKHQSNKE
jgi:hypothetical protein